MAKEKKKAARGQLAFDCDPQFRQVAKGWCALHDRKISDSMQLGFLLLASLKTSHHETMYAWLSDWQKNGYSCASINLGQDRDAPGLRLILDALDAYEKLSTSPDEADRKLADDILDAASAASAVPLKPRSTKSGKTRRRKAGGA